MNRPKSDLRYELKYLLRREQVAPLVAELSELLQTDRHGSETGNYRITSLYYDTPGYKSYWDKLDGHRSRRKVRVRVYGNVEVTPQTPAFVEVKQRVNKMMRKRRIELPYAEAVDFHCFDELAAARARMGVGEERGAQAALLQEAYYLYRTLQLRPVCVVTYDRVAFEGDANAPDLRITLDTNLRGRIHDLSLLSTGSARDLQVLGPEVAV